MSDLMKILTKHDGNIKNNLYRNSSVYYRSSSPGINYLFGKQGGMKGGNSMILYGPPKSGKSLISMDMIGQLHQNDPEAEAIKFDTEFRDESLEHWNKAFGIDDGRLAYVNTNKPEEIFDYIANDVVAGIQKEMEKRKTDDPTVGNPMKLIVIDSLAGIDYPKEANAEKTTDMQIGDAAAYLPKGFKRILPILKKYKISLIACQHIRDNMNTQTSKWKKYNVPGGRGIKHFIEYWMLVEKIEGKKAKIFDSSKLDGSGDPIKLGHSVRVTMEENSSGPQERSVDVDISYTEGMINAHEEVATIATNMGIIERPSAAYYVFEGKKWNGFENFVQAVKDDPQMQVNLIQKIKENDPL
jgi:RecA/RadA recombinase